MAALKSVLAKAGVKQAEIRRVAAALRALPNTFVYDEFYNGVPSELQNIDPTVNGYQEARGGATLNDYEKPVIVDNVVTVPERRSWVLGLSLSQIPYGTYHLNATNASGAPPVEIATFQVDASNLVSYDDGFTFMTEFSGTYGEAPATPLPEGVSLTEVTGVTVTDSQGVQRFAGGFTDATVRGTTRERRLHLLAGEAVPTASGTLISTVFHNVDYPSQSFTLSALGLPADATLTFLVNGVPVEEVVTGPAGRLYLKTLGAIFTKFLKPTDPVNLLLDGIDLFTAKSFAFSDAQGTILLSANSAQ